MLLYSLAVFVSAFLLFLVQPLIAKMILPWFGGSASVWNTCMLFFQLTLLAGYLYAHGSVRFLKPKTQGIVHLILLGISLISLPIIPAESWKPEGREQPLWQILLVLGATTGLPYFLCSTTGPLIQAWYARRFEKAIPYRLFALSNLASLLALLAYPFLIEPWFVTRLQAWGWTAGYLVFALLIGATAVSTVRGSATAGAAPTLAEAPTPGIPQMALWVLLAAFPSILLLAVTNHLTQNVAAIPFLWILPLTAYLLTFIFCFDSDRWYRPRLFRWITALAVCLMSCAINDMGPLDGLANKVGIPGIRWIVDHTKENLLFLIPCFVLGLFACCMFGHGELALRKPHPRHLTLFYAMVSVGGAVGGLLISLAAPLVLPAHYEFAFSLGLFSLTILMLVLRESVATDAVWAGAAIFTIAVALAEVKALKEDTVYMVRNFYGALRVQDTGSLENNDAIRTLVHGTINHGAEYLDDARAGQPITYYSPDSGVGLAIAEQRTGGVGQRVGLIGLGSGTLSVWGRQGDYYRIYELNPVVETIARSHFQYLRRTRASVDVVLGDGRLSLEREPPNNFDILAVDAFSSDSIPVHLLSREAFELYFRHLKPDGVLVVHVSNKFLDLPPVVHALARALGKQSLMVSNEPDADNEIFEADWILVTSNQALLDRPALRKHAKPAKLKPNLRLWTDGYSNLFQILK